MAEFETSTPQGELIVGKIVHGAMLNCMITSYEDPEDWFFKQFPTSAAVEQYAVENNLIMKWPEDGNHSS